MEKTHLRIDEVFIQSIKHEGRIQYLLYDNNNIQYMDIYQTADGKEHEPINKQYISTGCVILPEHPDFSAKPVDVFLSVRKFWKDNLLMDGQSIDVLAAFTYFTWFYDSTETAPYL